MDPLQIDWALLMRYLAGEASPADLAILSEWLEGNEERARYVESLRRIGDTVAHDAEAFVPGTAWDTVSRELGLELGQTPAKQRAPAAPQKTAVVGTRLGQPTWPRAPWWRGAVAAMVVAAIAVVAWLGPKVGKGPAMASREYVTLAGQRLAVTLDDGSQLTLGPESRLRIPAGYGLTSRDVTLEGEGYFTVVHNAAHPFAVHVRGAVMRDVGTSFDVRAYGYDASVRVAVAEGAVAIDFADGADHGALRSALHAGDLAWVSDETVTVDHNADIAALTGWRQGGLTFTETPLRDVVREVGRTFGVHVTVADSTLLANHVTAKFSGEPIGVVLDAITRMLGARYERTEHGFVIHRGVAGVRGRGDSTRPPLTTALREDGDE